LRIERVIASRFADPKFRQAHGQGREYEDSTNFFASPGFKELDAICGGRIGSNRPADVAATSMWSVGEDALNLTTFTKHKTGVAGLKSEELPPHLSHTHAAFEPLLIMEDDVADPADCFKRTVDVLLKHSPIPSGGMILFKLSNYDLKSKDTSTACCSSPGTKLISSPWVSSCQNHVMHPFDLHIQSIVG
jgi:hypothetical protein